MIVVVKFIMNGQELKCVDEFTYPFISLSQGALSPQECNKDTLTERYQQFSTLNIRKSIPLEFYTIVYLSVVSSIKGEAKEEKKNCADERNRKEDKTRLEGPSPESTALILTCSSLKRKISERTLT